METEDVFLDNLPESANMILNTLWMNNRRMLVSELTEEVNKRYQKGLNENDVKEFANLLVRADYLEKKFHKFKVYYSALGYQEEY